MVYYPPMHTAQKVAVDVFVPHKHTHTQFLKKYIKNINAYSFIYCVDDDYIQKSILSVLTHTRIASCHGIEPQYTEPHTEYAVCMRVASNDDVIFHCDSVLPSEF